jgi:hypothetical protein
MQETHTLDLGELEKTLIKYVNWCRMNKKQRTVRGHMQGIRNWFKKANEFKARDGGNGQVGGDHPVSNDSGLHSDRGNGAANNDLSLKLASYRKFLAANPRLAEEYLARQPARVQQAIREAGRG